MTFWLIEGKDEKETHKARAMLEMPPRGYTGKLYGTSWDDETMLNEYSTNTTIRK